jgi:hypothetical protein
VITFCAAVLAIGCADTRPYHRIVVRGPSRTLDPVTVSQGTYDVKGPPPECPRSDAWELLTWPEMEPVPSTLGVPSQTGFSCDMTITPDEPLSERWYAARWRGDPGSNLDSVDALQLRDESWVWRFRGVTHARVQSISSLGWGAHLFLQATTNEWIDPASGEDWSTLVTATQGAIDCVYPGETVTDGSGTIGFAETLVVDCMDVDWSAPIHIHIEGALTRSAPHLPMPVVDLDHTFSGREGSSELWIDDADEAPPPCADPRCE